MANLNINPTRMELMRLKTRLKTVMRGHKLLKDRSDEMVRQFVKLVYINKQLRQTLDQELAQVFRSFCVSQALMTTQEVEAALSMPHCRTEVEVEQGLVMGIDVPKLRLRVKESPQLFSYSFCFTSSQLDSAVAGAFGVAERLIRLAEVEKTCDILADEIQKIRRRVNALEQFTIPKIRQEMKRIVMKLDENERSNLVRLMKVKELILED